MKRIIMMHEDSQGEGSRGGHVIGHDSKGRPIYQGHSWQSVHGKREITGKHEATGRVMIRTGDSNNQALLLMEEVHSEIDQDTKWFEHRQSIQKKEEAAAHKEREESRVGGFTDGMIPTQKARAVEALNRSITSGGKLYTRKSLVEHEVSEGATVRVHPKSGKRRLEDPNGAFLEESQISKTAMDYAEFLTRKKDDV